MRALSTKRLITPLQEIRVEEESETSLVGKSVVLHDTELGWEVHQRNLLNCLVQVVVAHEDVLKGAHVAEVEVNMTAACIVEYCLAVGISLALN